MLDCQCARCGSSCVWEECWECGGDGEIGRHDEDPLYYDEDEMFRCETCEGSGGWALCCSSPEWCEANPMPGHEKVKRGAIEWFEVSDA